MCFSLSLYMVFFVLQKWLDVTEKYLYLLIDSALFGTALFIIPKMSVHVRYHSSVVHGDICQRSNKTPFLTVFSLVNPE